MEPSRPPRSHRVRALLDRLLRQRVQTRLAPLLELRGRGRDLKGSLDRGDRRLEQLDVCLESLEQLAPKAPFTGTMTMDQAWKHHPSASEIFSRHHLPACDSCAVRFDETLDEAARAYSLDLDSLLMELNSLLEGP